MAGLEQIITYLKNLSFTEEDIEYLRSKNIFCEDFFDYLRSFEFKCDVWSIPEGYPIFPHEPVPVDLRDDFSPLIRIRGQGIPES